MVNLLVVGSCSQGPKVEGRHTPNVGYSLLQSSGILLSFRISNLHHQWSIAALGGREGVTSNQALPQHQPNSQAWSDSDVVRQ